MRIYAVYEEAGSPSHDADEDVVLVKEGFCWPALCFSLIWVLYHRLWLVAITIVILLAGSGVALVFLRGGESYVALGLIAVALVLGAEGNNLRQYFLVSGGHSFSGVVAGRDVPEAELRLFSALGPRIYLP
jgi:hypothetical protein